MTTTMITAAAVQGRNARTVMAVVIVTITRPTVLTSYIVAVMAYAIGAMARVIGPLALAAR
jgi:hypothetical protein